MKRSLEPLHLNRRLTRLAARLRPLAGARVGMVALAFSMALATAAGPLQPAHATGGTVFAWGWNGYGQRSVPAGLSNVIAVAAGDDHSLALKSDGTVVAWGRNDEGQSNVPPGLSDVIAVAGGGYHSLVLKSDGTVVAWGCGSQNLGQCNVPAGLNSVIAIAAGAYYNLALKSDGTVVAWGNNVWGQTDVPAGLSGVIAVAAGHSHSLALKSDGTIVAWGNNSYNQATIPAGLSGVIAVAGGSLHSLALKSDGTVVAWGRNDEGQSNVPPGLSDVIAVATGAHHSLALKSDGTVVAWGYNSFGQGTVPSGLGGVTSVAAGFAHNLAITVLDLTDTTPPVITPNVAGSLGNNDWYVGNVTVNWTVTDPESAIASQTGCDPVTVNADTNGVTLTCSATSAGGASSQSVTVKRDATAPTLAPVVSPNPVVLGGAATVSSGAADTLSGLAAQACGTLDTSTVGAKSVTCTATDHAGNTANANASYSVVYAWSGFFQPVDNLPVLNQVHAGAGISVKFSLAGDQGLNILAAGSPSSQQIACDSNAPATDIEETVASGNSGLSYDAVTGQYSYTWKTDKGWANTCRQLVVTLVDGTPHLANFKFK